MNLTDEQIAIVATDGDQQVNAVAGSGKTSTLVWYAKDRPEQRMIYLVFNKAMKEEAQRKFASEGVHNVTVETAHSLAFGNIIRGSNYDFEPKGIKLWDMMDYVELPEENANVGTMILLSHIRKLLAIYCGSDAESIDEIDYYAYARSEKAEQYIEKNREEIYERAEMFWRKQINAEIPVSHDFYLKAYQLSRPELNYDCVLFDEAQDASMVMLDIFRNQRGTKIIVGDEFQQIYGWRFSVNAFAESDFRPMSLSISWRFGKEIAELAQNAVGLRRMIGLGDALKISGARTTDPDTSTSAILSRGNIGLLKRAIKKVDEDPSTWLYFVGGFHQYTYANSASVWDVLNLFLGKPDRVKDFTLRKLGTFEKLEEYCEETDDAELSVLTALVNEYGAKLPELIDRIRERSVPEFQPGSIYCATTHKAKGFEFDTVELDNSFITAEAIDKAIAKGMTTKQRASICEEINLLYVAITRARREIKIPRELLPFAKPSEYVICK